MSHLHDDMPADPATGQFELRLRGLSPAATSRGAVDAAYEAGLRDGRALASGASPAGGMLRLTGLAAALVVAAGAGWVASTTTRVHGTSMPVAQRSEEPAAAQRDAAPTPRAPMLPAPALLAGEPRPVTLREMSPMSSIALRRVMLSHSDAELHLVPPAPEPAGQAGARNSWAASAPTLAELMRELPRTPL